MIIIFQIIYFANLFIAGIVGVISLLNPNLAKEAVFQNAFAESEVVRITGAFWCAIALLSAFGLFQPEKFVLVFFIQLLYKGLWLLVGVLPKVLKKAYSEIPVGMSLFFLAYVLFLPFIVPFAKFF